MEHHKKWVVVHHGTHENSYLEFVNYQGSPLWNSNPKVARRFQQDEAEKVAAMFASDVHACFAPKIPELTELEADYGDAS